MPTRTARRPTLWTCHHCGQQYDSHYGISGGGRRCCSQRCMDILRARGIAPWSLYSENQSNAHQTRRAPLAPLAERPAFCPRCHGFVATRATEAEGAREAQCVNCGWEREYRV